MIRSKLHNLKDLLNQQLNSTRKHQYFWNMEFNGIYLMCLNRGIRNVLYNDFILN